MINNTIVSKIYQTNGRKIDFTESNLQVYNIGCGKQNYPGVHGIDFANYDHLLVRHDLNAHPWPVADNSADIILTFHFLEHIGDLYKTFEEIYRIGKNGCRVVIEVPYFRSGAAFQDPTHIHFFTSNTFSYFCKPNHTYTELPIKFNIVDFSFGWPTVNSKNPIKKWVKHWLNKHKKLYDDWLYIFKPVKILVVEMEVVKQTTSF